MASTCDADHDRPLRCQFGALKVRTHLALIETRNLSESDADCVSLPIQRLRFNAVDRREIGVQHYAFTADFVDKSPKLISG